MRLKHNFIEAVANAVSMITVPFGAMSLGAEPLSPWGWVLLGIGVAVQVAKYYCEDK